jgi:hypothetical protein
MTGDILGSAKKVTSFFDSNGYPKTAAATEDDLKKKFNALLKQAKEDKIKPIELNAENLIEMLDIAAATPAVPAVPGGAAATPVVPGGAISTIVGGASLDQAKLIARVLNNALTNDNYKAKTIAATLKERGVALKDAAAALNQKGLRLDSKGKFDALQELYNDETDIDIAVAVAWVGLSPGTAGGPAAATDYNSLNKRLEELKATGIKLTPENLIEMLDIAATTPAVPAVGGAATPAVPGGAIKTIAASIVAAATSSSPTTQAVEEAKLMAKLLNTALIDDKRSDKAKTIAATLKERGVALKDAAAALNQQELRLDSKGKFYALWKSYYLNETDINIAVATAWGGLPGTAGGPAAATDYNSLNKRLEELKATGIELTPENLSQMLDAAGHDGTTPGGQIKVIAPGGSGDEVRLMARVLNNCLVDEDNKRKIISDVLDRKDVDLKKIDIKLPELKGDAKELQNAGGFQQLYEDAVENNHITKDNINKFTAALVKHRRDQEDKLWVTKTMKTISKGNFVDMMVITCRAYKQKGASDIDVQNMLKSFANQYAGYFFHNAKPSDKDNILQQAAGELFDAQKVEKIVNDFHPMNSLYKKPASEVKAPVATESRSRHSGGSGEKWR